MTILALTCAHDTHFIRMASDSDSLSMQLQASANPHGKQAGKKPAADDARPGKAALPHQPCTAPQAAVDRASSKPSRLCMHAILGNSTSLISPKTGCKLLYVFWK